MSRRHSESRQSPTKHKPHSAERNIGVQPVVDDQPTVKPQAADLEEPSAEELTPLQELTEVTAVEAQPADELETTYPDKSDEQLSFIEYSLVDLRPGVDDDDEFVWNWDWSEDDPAQDSHPSAVTPMPG